MNFFHKNQPSTAAAIKPDDIQCMINEYKDQIKNFKREWTEYITQWSNALIHLKWNKAIPMNSKMLTYLDRLEAIEYKVDLLSSQISSFGLTPYYQPELQKLQRSLGDKRKHNLFL